MKRTISLAMLCVLLVAGAIWAKSENGTIPKGVIADKIIVEKSIRRLTLMKDGTALKTYEIALGRNPIGTKEREGDNRTPEGTYKIDRRNDRSRFYRSLHISYPTAAQVENRLTAARREGLRLRSLA